MASQLRLGLRPPVARSRSLCQPDLHPQCPDSSLVLRCTILQQAATLVTAGKSTARCKKEQTLTCAVYYSWDIETSLAAAAREAPLPPASSRLSDHGKVVVGPSNAATSGTIVDIKFARVVGSEEEEEVYKAVIETSGAVSLVQPGLPQHAVICPSVPAAKLWLEHFHEEAADEGVEEAGPTAPPSQMLPKME